MQIQFDKIDPIFLFDFTREGNKFFVQVMGEGRFEVEFKAWIKLRDSRTELNSRIDEVDAWQVRNVEPVKLERLQRKRNKKVYRPIRENTELDNMGLLEKLSGTSYVNGEVYDFRKNGNGTQQIIVDGKPTSCWIDSENKIGSYSGGGPSVIQWLGWFNHSPRQAYEIVKTVQGLH